MNLYEQHVMEPPAIAAGRSGITTRAASLVGLFFSLGILGAGCDTAPRPSSLIRSATAVARHGKSYREPPPPPAELAITPPNIDRVERWAPPARLVGHDGGHHALDSSFDGTGLQMAIRHADSVSVWQREPGSKAWTQVLNEPWRAYRLTWKKDELVACGPEGAIKASFVADHAEWRTVGGDECGGESTSASAPPAEGWAVAAVRGTEHCFQPRMQQPPPCTYDRNFVITGPGGARTTLVGSSESVSSMSPSGRFFVFQYLNGVVTVYETNTRKTRSTDATEEGYSPPTVRTVRWLPDESAFAIVFASGSVGFVSPRTGTTTWKVPLPRKTSGSVHLRAGTGEPWLGDYADLRQRKALVVEKGSAPYPTTFPRDATRKLLLPEARRIAALGQGTWALWDDAEGNYHALMAADPRVKDAWNRACQTYRGHR